MLLKIIRKFDAAHRLPSYKGVCSKLHGHRYKIVFTIEGKIAKSGMVKDFKKLKKSLDENLPDHAYLNNLLKNPTCENIACYLAKKFSRLLEKNWNLTLKELELWESETSAVCIKNTNSKQSFEDEI